MQLPLISETLLQVNISFVTFVVNHPTLTVFKAVGRRLRVPRFGDKVDYFHYRYTSIFLLFLLAWVLYHMNISKDPIICWIQMEISKDPNTDWKRFIYDYCFIEGTYFVRDGYPLSDYTRKRITYYQWVPVILALQAFCFYTPYFIWKTVNMASGLHVVSILSELRKLTEYTKFNDRKKGVELLSEYLNHTLLMQQKLGSRGAACLTKYRGFYLSMWYLVVKLLFTLNVIGQFFFLALVFGENNLLWGIGIVRDLLAGREWKQSGTFPRITYCDFPRRNMLNTKEEPYQCLLKINLLNEKIFLALYFWYLFLAIMSVFNFLRWINNIVGCGHRYRVILRFLRVRDVIPGGYHRERHIDVERFVSEHLKADGSLVLYFIGSQVNDMLACQITEILFKLWLKERMSFASGILPPTSSFNGKISSLKEEVPSTLMSSTPEKSPEEIITDTPMDELMSETKSDEPLVNTYTDDEGHIISKTKWRKLQWHKSHPNA